MKQSTKFSLIAAAMSGLMAGVTSTTMASTPSLSSGKASVSTSNKVVKNVAGVRAMEEPTTKGSHDCKGKNDCKGQGGCKTGDNGCKGKNSCKGTGGCKSMPEKTSDGNGK